MNPSTAFTADQMASRKKEIREKKKAKAKLEKEAKERADKGPGQPDVPQQKNGDVGDLVEMPNHEEMLGNGEEEKLQEMTDLLEQFSQKPAAFKQNHHSEDKLFSQFVNSAVDGDRGDEDAELAAAIAASLEQMQHESA